MFGFGKVKAETLIAIENWLVEVRSGNCTESDKDIIIKVMNDNRDKLKPTMKAVDLAIRMPYDEVAERLVKYDSSNPPMDTLVFLDSLMAQYNASRKDVTKRIKHIRWIQWYKQKQKEIVSDNNR